VKVVVTGATGNVGTSLVEALAADERVTEIVGIARRAPAWHAAKTRWVAADITESDLAPLFDGAAAVVHLAWLIQPSRVEARLERVNVRGSARVFAAAAEAEVGALVHASSIGAYAPGPKDRAVDESWPATGIETSFYARHKAAAERELDTVEQAHPGLRVVRLRPALCFKREAATGIRRLFAGPFLPSPLVRPELIPIVPDVEGLRFQAVHSDDVADAYRRAALDENASGAYNIAAEPVLDPEVLARALGARRVRVAPEALRRAAELSWSLHLQPTPPGWLDMGLSVPLLDTRRAREELGWEPRRDAVATLLELLEGMRQGAGLPTPPLDPATSGPLRSLELLGGIGHREPDPGSVRSGVGSRA
jgi:nucleoside-diphosphate-sugar epimerase